MSAYFRNDQDETIKFVFSTPKEILTDPFEQESTKGYYDTIYIVAPEDFNLVVMHYIYMPDLISCFIMKSINDLTIHICITRIIELEKEGLHKSKFFKEFISVYTIMYNRLREICKNKTSEKNKRRV